MEFLWIGIRFMEVEGESRYRISFEVTKNGEDKEVHFYLTITAPFVLWEQDAIALKTFYAVDSYCELSIERDFSVEILEGNDKVFLLALFLPTLIKIFCTEDQVEMDSTEVMIVFKPPVKILKSDKLLKYFRDEYLQASSLQ